MPRLDKVHNHTHIQTHMHTLIHTHRAEKLEAAGQLASHPEQTQSIYNLKNDFWVAGIQLFVTQEAVLNGEPR